MIGLIIILVFPFIYFYTQMNRFNEKTGNIRKAIDKGQETYVDPLTGKNHWIENGEQVIWTEILSIEKNIPEGCIVGDQILRGVKSGKIYKNRSRERFQIHIQKQMDAGKIWCWERNEYNNQNHKDNGLRYNMKDKYFYSLYWDWNSVSYYIRYYNTKEKEPITFERYKELGGYDWQDKGEGYRR